MSKSAIKRFVPVVNLMCVLVLFSLVLAGCNSTGKQANDIYETKPLEAIEYSEGLNPAKEPHTINVLVPNGLVETEVHEEIGEAYYTYPAFSGLESSAMEVALNVNVQSLVEKVKQSLDPKTIVPYRGVKQIIREDSVVKQKSVYAYTTFSYNNILSISVHGSASYKSDYALSTAIVDPAYGQGEVYLYTMETMVVDLGTGKPIPLKSLFIDGYDYVSVINDYIVNELGENSATDEVADVFGYSPFKLVKPFDGIDENQPFSIDMYGLTLLFAPSDARFDNALGSVSVNVPLEVFGESLAIDTRYYTQGDSLYKDKKEKRAFTSWNNRSEYSEVYHEGSYKGGTWTVTVSKMDAFDNKILNALVEDTVVSLSAIDSDDTQGSIYVQISSSTVGSYMIVGKNYWNDNNGVSISSNETYIYDASGKRLTLEDLFVPGFDYLSVIKKEIHEEWATIQESDFEQMVPLMGFNLNTHSIDFYFNSDELNNPYEAIWLSLTFDVFGVENLVIFEK